MLMEKTTMPLERSNDIPFHTAFSFDGETITLERDLVSGVESLPGGFLEFDVSGWESVRGYSGQHGYDGPVMHASEIFSPNVLEALHERFGDRATYALTVVEEYNDEFDEYDAVGWMILVKSN